MQNRKNARKVFKALLPTISLIVIIGALSVIFFPHIAALATEEGRRRLIAFIEEIGFGGWLVTLGIQIFQIIIAFLPGEPVELMLGAIWGPWLGTLTCLIGVFIGTLLIFLLSRRLGIGFVKRAAGEKNIGKYKFLGSEKGLEITVFLLFFIPGTPKDVLTYIVPLTPIRPVRYLVISTLARIPSILTSTVLADSILNGRYAMSIAVFAITAVISIAGIFVGKHYVRRKQTNADTSGEADCPFEEDK